MRLIVLMVLVVLLMTPCLEGEIFNTATLLNPGDFSFSFEEQRNFGPDNWIFFFHLGTGLAQHRADLEIVLGFPSGGGDRYTGINVEAALSRAHPAISLALGAHRQGDVSGADLTLLISGKFGDEGGLQPYIGLDLNYEFPEDNEYYIVNALLGFEVRLADETSLIIEAGDDIATDLDNEPDASYISAGIVIYFF